jgi:hypothetical protein
MDARIRISRINGAGHSLVAIACAGLIIPQTGFVSGNDRAVTATLALPF